MDAFGDLSRKLAEWQEAGLISAEQADRIREREGGDRTAPRPKASFLAEVLGYLGGALAVVAAIVLAGQYWDRMADGTRLALLGVTTLVVGGAAALLGQRATPAMQRLADFLFVLATVSLAFTVVIAADIAGLGETATAMLATGVAAAVSILLYLGRRSVVRHVALFGSILGFGLATGTLADTLDPRMVGLAVWAFGLAWGLLVWSGVLRPRDTGHLLAAGALLVGAMVFGGEDEGLILGLVTAAGLVAAGVFLNSAWVLAVGTLGVFVFVPRVVFDWFGDTGGGALALLITGLLLLGVAVFVNRIGRRVLQAAREEKAHPVRERLAAGRGTVGIAGAAAVLVLAGLYIVFVGTTPLPEFFPLEGSGVEAPGTIAFTHWGGDNSCVMTIPASGGPEHEVACFAFGIGPLAWTADGDLAVVIYEKDQPEVWVIDPATGDVVATVSGFAAESAVVAVYDQRIRRDDGAVLRAEGGNGLGFIDVVRTGVPTVRVLEVEGPSSYGIWEVQWSPDGAWILGVDSSNRMFLLSADGTAGPFLVVEDAAGPAWFIPGNPAHTVDLP